MTGTDWRNYELSYYNASLKTVLDERFEIGYGILQSISNYLSIDFWSFHITLKIIVFCVLCRAINYFKVNLMFFWALFLPEMGFFLFIDCPFRNLIAFGIFCCAVPALSKRCAKEYFLWVTIAICFHTSAFILYFIYLLRNVHLKNKYWVLLFIATNVIAYDIEYIINNVFNALFGSIPFLQDKLLYYVLNDDFLSSKINIGSIYRILLFILFLCGRSKIEEGHKYGNLLFYLSMIYFTIYPFTISLKIFSRFSIYLLPFCLLAMIVLVRTMKKPIMRYSFLGLLLLWTFAKNYTVLTADCRYIPYTNYLQYWMEEKPSYHYRSNYNLHNSPYDEF